MTPISFMNLLSEEWRHEWAEEKDYRFEQAGFSCWTPNGLEEYNYSEDE